jgi:hypothetical protein
MGDIEYSFNPITVQTLASVDGKQRIESVLMFIGAIRGNLRRAR